MRKRSEVLTWTAYALVVAWLAVALPFPGVPAALSFLRSLAVEATPVTVLVEDRPSATSTPLTGRAWFAAARPHCTTGEVQRHLARNPAPQGMEGTGYAAACLALAGKIDAARGRLESLEGEERWMAAGIVFGPSHEIADAGDELAAGPAMELVVEFWSNHHQALYHAGAARFERGDATEAREYLERFLAVYDGDDVWRRDALQKLETLDGG